MTANFRQALTDAAARAPQHAAYLHALIHAVDVDDAPADQVEWSHDTDCSLETCDDGQHPRTTLPR